MRVKKELSLLNESAVQSLEEGLEQTLTLRRLGLFEKLKRSLKTSNTIESLMPVFPARWSPPFALSWFEIGGGHPGKGW